MTGKEPFDFDATEQRPDPALFEQPAAEPPYARYRLTSPLHDEIARCSKTNLWTDWGEVTTPLTYTDAREEYQALRAAAAIGDISPLCKFRVSGNDATAYLSRLLASRVATLAIHKASHVAMCSDTGHIIADGLLFRMAEGDYRLTFLESHLDWMQDSAHGFNVLIEDIGPTVAGISLQGPATFAVMQAAGFDEMQALAPFESRWVELMGIPVYVSRTGQTGGLGVELWVDPEDAPLLWRLLMKNGAPLGLKPMGFSVRDLARLEAGIPAAGVDYLSAHRATDLLSVRTPLELGLSVPLEGETGPFTGQAALKRACANPVRHRLIGLEVAADGPVDFSALYAGPVRVGTATTKGWSPLLARNIALATVSAEGLADNVNLTVHAAVSEGVAMRRRQLDVRRLPRPFLAIDSKSG